jgi:Domain of unknown function (DUF6754)
MPKRTFFYLIFLLASQVSFSWAQAPNPLANAWFNPGLTNAFVGACLLFLLVELSVWRAKTGKPMFIRRIAGLSAVEEAVGRATEMGRPVLYLTGMNDLSDIATISAVNILSQVAKKTAEYEIPLIVPNRDPVTYTVTQEVVKQAYTEAGRPDAYNAHNIYYITGDQMGYAAAVDGIILRENPATNFFMGYYYAEALILAETGNITGAIQIAGTDSVTQLPFFITSCDYTLMGEELYAASAYLSREPVLVGTLKAQDWCKLIITFLLLASTVWALAFRNDWFLNLFNIG